MYDTFLNWCQNFLNELSVSSWLVKAITILAVVFLGWLIARILGSLIYRLAKRIDKGGRVSRYLYLPLATSKSLSGDTFARVTGKFFYYSIMLMVFAATLDVLGIPRPGGPLYLMFGGLVPAIPGIIKAFAILYCAWILASFVRHFVEAALNKVDFDSKVRNLAGNEEIGHSADSVASIAATIAYYFIFVFALVPAFTAIGLPSLSEPVLAIVSRITGFLPNVIAAGIIVFIAYLLGRLLRTISGQLCEKLGVDSFADKLGLSSRGGELRASEVIGHVVFAVILLFGIVEASNLVGLKAIGSLGERLLGFLPQVAIASLIIVLGFMLGDYCKRLVASRVKPQDSYWGIVTKGAIVALSIVAASEEAGIASSFTHTAFTIILAALGLGSALAFGLGSRESAGNFVKKQLIRLNKPE